MPSGISALAGQGAYARGVAPFTGLIEGFIGPDGDVESADRTRT